MQSYVFLFFLIFSTLSWGKIIDTDISNKTVYVHPTPVLELTVVELDKNSGVLYITMDYISERSKKEMDSFKSQYPDYNLHVVQAQIDGAVQFNIKGVLESEFKMMQGQIGPLINTAISLNGTQLKMIKGNRNSLTSILEISVPVKFRYNKNQILESYTVSSDYCKSIGARTVRDLVLAFSKMEKPQGLKYEATYLNLKEQLLDQCFQVKSASVQSFKDLLSLKVEAETQTQAITGVHSSRIEGSISQTLIPVTEIRIE